MAPEQTTEFSFGWAESEQPSAGGPSQSNLQLVPKSHAYFAHWDQLDIAPYAHPLLSRSVCSGLVSHHEQTLLPVHITYAHRI